MIYFLSPVQFEHYQWLKCSINSLICSTILHDINRNEKSYFKVEQIVKCVKHRWILLRRESLLLLLLLLLLHVVGKQEVVVAFAHQLYKVTLASRVPPTLDHVFVFLARSVTHLLSPFFPQSLFVRFVSFLISVRLEVSVFLFFIAPVQLLQLFGFANIANCCRLKNHSKLFYFILLLFPN